MYCELNIDNAARPANHHQDDNRDELKQDPHAHEFIGTRTLFV